MKMKNNALTLILRSVCVLFLFCMVAVGQRPEPELKGGKPYAPGEDEASKAWLDKAIGMNDPKKIGADSPKLGKAPTARTRGDQVYNCGNASFKGKCTMYGFTNYDITTDWFLKDRTCGQAALATAIWDQGYPVVQNTFKYNPAAFAKEILRVAPPKITLGGWLPVNAAVGTDWRQFNYGLDQYKAYGIKYAWIRGEAEVQNQIAAGRVVAVMIDLGTLSASRYPMHSGAHWVVMYGFDNDKYYVTNFDGNVLYRSDLRDAWGMSPNNNVGVYAKGHGTAGMGVVIYK